jgi:hypothetical protein
MTDGKWPHLLSYSTGPGVHGMEENSSSTFSDSADESLSNPILPMGADGTEGKFLLMFHAGVLECLGGIYAVVGSDGLDGNIVSGSPFLEFLLGSEELGDGFAGMESHVD